MSDAPELRTQVRRWFVETGWTDGNGIGLWARTDASVEVPSKAEAEALRDQWLSQGKIEADRWGSLKRTGPYGAFRIRSMWDDATPAALAACPEVQALIREAEARGMEQAAQIAAESAADAKEDPGTGWASHSWLMTVCRILEAEAAAIRGEGK